MRRSGSREHSVKRHSEVGGGPPCVTKNCPPRGMWFWYERRDPPLREAATAFRRMVAHRRGSARC